MRQLLLALPALLLCSTHAHADETTAAAGRTYQGTLSAGDETYDDGSFVDYYSITVQRGQRLVVTLRSSAFDSWLQLHLPEDQGGVQFNDDINGTTLDSQIAHTFARAGTYRFGATLTGSRTSGAYSIQFESSGGGAPAASLGDVRTGRLEAGDQVYEDGSFVDYYTLSVVAGQTISATLSSSDFDSWLQLELPEDQGGALYNDDISNETLDARIVHRFTQAGEYRFGATTRSPGTQGAYSLRFELGAMGAPTASNSGSEVLRGQLDSSDRTLGTSGEYYDHHLLHCVAGDRIRIYTASQIDTYLIVNAPGLAAQLEDDDSGSGLNAEIEFTASQSGDLEISVTTASPGQTGAYDLVVEGATPYAAGRNYAGALSPGDQTLTTGEYTDSYTFYASAGETVELTLQSSEFDPYLILRPPTGTNVENDDAEGHGVWHHSRITHQCAVSGEYQVLTTSFQPGETGQYALWVRRPSGEGAQLVDGVQLLNGELRAGTATRPQGQYVVSYSFEGRKGQQVRIDMRSDELDPYLQLVPPAGDTIEHDDIASGDVNARIETTLSATGSYRVIATSFAAGQTGAFTLSADGLDTRLVADSSSAVTASRDYWAIICGISDYDGRGDLPNCRRDAERLAGGLVNDGVLHSENLILLTDSEATAAGVRNAFATIAPKVQPGDIFLFFYSGHGTRGELDERATDEADRRDEFLALYEGSISDDEMKRLYATIPAKLAILCLDSCFSGGFARDVISDPGRLGIFSSEEDVVSLVASEFNAGGYLAHFFRRGLRGEADKDGDSTVTVGEIDWFLRREFNKLDIETETDEGALGYQRLVIERGGVQVTEPLVRLRN